MNTLAGLLAEPPVQTESADPFCADIGPESLPNNPTDSFCEEQIQALVQQLFLQHAPRARHVGFAALERGASAGPLCLQVARTLAESGTRDVGLIDAQLSSDSLLDQLHLQTRRPDSPWALAPRLWLVPRTNWLDGDSSKVWNSSLTRLRTAAMEFDSSVVCFDSFSWITSRISQTCDGLVLVVTANKTRRLVAAQIRDQIRKARIALLGVVLAERRLPVPEGLYWSL